MTTRETNPADWFLLASERLRAADALFGSLGSTWSGIELLHEAVERYLKGWLIGKGWTLVKTHDLQHLMAEAVAREPAFNAFMSLAIDLTDRFFAQHYPGDDLTDVETHYPELRRQTDGLLRLIRGDSP
jgi:HEPN domain-containing protein